MAQRDYSNAGLYEFIDKIRTELKGDILRVEDKVDKVQERQTITSTKLVMLIGSITVVVSAIITVLVQRILQ